MCMCDFLELILFATPAILFHKWHKWYIGGKLWIQFISLNIWELIGKAIHWKGRKSIRSWSHLPGTFVSQTIWDANYKLFFIVLMTLVVTQWKEITTQIYLCSNEGYPLRDPEQGINRAVHRLLFFVCLVLKHKRSAYIKLSYFTFMTP